MRRYTKYEFNKLLVANGFVLERQSGGHLIYKRNGNEICVVPQRIQEPIARRLIKEHKLVVDRLGKGVRKR